MIGRTTRVHHHRHPILSDTQLSTALNVRAANKDSLNGVTTGRARQHGPTNDRHD